MTEVLFLLASISGIPTAHDPRCESTQTSDLISCAAEGYRSADEALNQQWRITLAKVKARDGDFDRDSRKANGDVSFSQALLVSQRAWLAYRDAECRLQVYANVDGRELPIYRFGCLTNLTEQRTKTLKELAEQN